MVVNANDRKEDFYIRLENIEFQASRISKNPSCRKFESLPEPGRSGVQKEGMHLLTVVIKFLNDALRYFSLSFGRTTEVII